MRGFTLIDLAKMRTRGEGVQNPENFADVLYVWPLSVTLTLISVVDMFSLQIVISSELNHDICQGETISSSNKFTVMLFRRFPQLHSNTIPSIPPDFEARKRLNWR